jgi:hypothetical protein
MGQGFTYREYELNTGRLLASGSFHGEVNPDTIEMMVNRYDAEVTNSGDVHFVNRRGDKISLYIHVYPKNTKKGQNAYKSWRVEEEKGLAAEYAKIEKEKEAIEEAMRGLSNEEILVRLRGGFE